MSVNSTTDMSFAISDYTEISDERQQFTDKNILTDVDKKGDEKPWKDKKQRSLKLSDSYKRIGNIKRASSVKFCGNTLIFKQCRIDGFKKLIGADFCKDRLCPMCNWRRSKMLAKQIITILHEAGKEQPLKFIFLTLTMQNVRGEELPQAINNLFKSFDRLFKRTEVNKVVIGYVRNLEITRNLKSYKNNKWFNTYHPHFHVLIGVPVWYCNRANKDYIKQDRWVELWQQALKVDYMPSVNVKIVKPKREGQNIEAAAFETGKYAVKDSDYIVEKKDKQSGKMKVDTKLTDDGVRILSEALKGRRLVSFGKLFKEIKKLLKLKDVEDQKDLVGADQETGCTCPVCNSTLEETLYTWNMGLQDYVEGRYLDN